MRIFSTVASLSIASLFASVSPASAGGFAVSSGVEGGHYSYVARGLRAVMHGDHGVLISLRSSEGSIMNLARLDDPEDRTSIALTQTDALQFYIADHPDFPKEYVELASVGKECVFLVAGKKSGIASLADLKAKGDSAVAVGELGSGAAVTWSYMNRLEPGFVGSRPVNLDILEAMLQLRQTSKPAEVEAAMFVQRPISTGTPVETVIAHQDLYRFLPISTDDVSPPILAADPAYTFEKITVGFGRDGQVSIDTMCTRGLMIASKSKLDGEQLDLLKKVVLTSRRYFLPDGE